MSAFTSIEIVAAIAIVIVLAAVTLGSLSRIRSSSEQVRCVSNLRQIGQAVILYAGEEQGKAPASYSMDWPAWIKTLISRGYLDSTKALACPSDSNPGRNITLISGPDRINIHNSYGANEALVADWNVNFSRLNTVVNPSKVPMAADCTATVFSGENADQRARITNANDKAVWTTTQAADPKLKRHPKGNAICFADGHVEVISQDVSQNGQSKGTIKYNPR